MYLAYLGTALPPLEEWSKAHLEQFRLSLGEVKAEKLKEGFARFVVEGGDGSTLASYAEVVFVRLFGDILGPELYAKLQALKRKGTPINFLLYPLLRV